MPKKATLITGAAGEIGQALLYELRSSPDPIVTFDLQDLPPKLSKNVTHIKGSITDKQLLEKLAADYEFDRIYHLAAYLSTKAERTPALAHQVNVEASAWLLELAAQQSERSGHSVQFIFPSSKAIYGVPDLIVHTSWLADRFPQLVPAFENESPAPHVTGGDRPGHYVVFDIKFTTGLDGPEKKLACANYAAQTRIYSFMLGQLQGLMPHHAYIVARDRLFDPMPIRITSALDQPLDDDLASLRDHFLQIKLAGSKYLPWRDSIVESNLSNKDEGWTTAKELIATDKVPGRDPALLYQVSLSIKRELHSLGFSNLDSLLAIDPVRVPLEKCKGLGPKRSKMMRAILEANRSGNPVRPNPAMVPQRRKHEFFVDFEYLTNLNVDFEGQWPTLAGREMIFMVGVGQNSPSGWIFIPFVAAAENQEQEREMFLQFTDFLNQRTNGTATDPSETVLYHWTSAEVWQSKRSSDRLGFAADHPLRVLPWCDLQKPFIEGPGALPKAWAYGLKEMAGALGYISPELVVEWPEDLCDGLNAMVMGWQAYSQPEPVQSNEMALLTRYLEVDCASLHAILKWLRA